MRTWLVLLAICLPVVLHAQDPGTTIILHISINNKPISTKEELKAFKVQLNGLDHSWSINNDDVNNAYLRYFEWDPYHEDTFIIEIRYLSQVMILELKMNLKDNPNAVVSKRRSGDQFTLWNVVFALDVPFKPGYYMVDQFVPGSWDIEYKLAPGFKWINTQR